MLNDSTRLVDLTVGDLKALIRDIEQARKQSMVAVRPTANPQPKIPFEMQETLRHYIRVALFSTLQKWKVLQGLAGKGRLIDIPMSDFDDELIRLLIEDDIAKVIDRKDKSLVIDGLKVSQQSINKMINDICDAKIARTKGVESVIDIDAVKTNRQNLIDRMILEIFTTPVTRVLVGDESGHWTSTKPGYFDDMVKLAFEADKLLSLTQIRLPTDLCSQLLAFRDKDWIPEVTLLQDEGGQNWAIQAEFEASGSRTIRFIAENRVMHYLVSGDVLDAMLDKLMATIHHLHFERESDVPIRS